MHSPDNPIPTRSRDTRKTGGTDWYRSLFDSLDAGFCVVEMKFDEARRPIDYRFLEVNPAFERHTGLVGAAGRWMRDLAPDHEQHWFDLYGEVALSGTPVRFEEQAGALGRVYEVRASSIGEPAAHWVAILFTDITARRRVELELARSEAHWRGLFEQLNEGFVLGELIHDADGRVVDWRFIDVNPACGTMLGLPVEALAGRRLREVFPEIEPMWIDEVTDVVASGQPSSLTGRIASIDRWYEGRVYRVDERRFTATFIETTARRRAELRRIALLELSDRLRDMQEPTAMTLVAAEILGRTLQLCRTGYGFISADGETADVKSDWTAPGISSVAGVHQMRHYGSFIDELNAGQTVVVADTHRDPRTAAHAASLDALGIRALLNLPLIENGRAVAFIFANSQEPLEWSESDITFARELAERTRLAVERRTAEARLRALNASLEMLIETRTRELMKSEEQLRQSQKMEAVGQLTGGIAHDFNNLLTGITGSLELLQNRAVRGLSGDLEGYVNAALGASRRAAALTHRLLAFSRRQTLEPNAIDLNRLVSGMEELVRRTMGPAVDIEVVTAGGLWRTFVDAHQLENALLNLCINARDAMPDGGHLTIETANRWLDEKAAREQEVPPGHYVCLCVTDNGIGMPPGVVAKAFEPFFTTKPLGMGTGLGLSMIYGFARQSGGQARIHSAPNQGTTVCLYLPRHRGGDEAADPGEPSSSMPRAGAGETVLVVDDEPTIRMLVVEVLEELGYRAIEAADGATGLKILESDVRIDLLVTDVGLPGGLNGRQMADAGRKHRADLKVLFITGYAENAIADPGRPDASMHVLTKPFSIDALALRIRQLIAGG